MFIEFWKVWDIFVNSEKGFLLWSGWEEHTSIPTLNSIFFHWWRVSWGGIDLLDISYTEWWEQICCNFFRCLLLSCGREVNWDFFDCLMLFFSYMLFFRLSFFRVAGGCEVSHLIWNNTEVVVVDKLIVLVNSMNLCGQSDLSWLASQDNETSTCNTLKQHFFMIY